MVLQSQGGEIYLAWWTDADEVVDRWVYIPVSRMRLKDILSGTISPLYAFEQPESGYLLAVDRDAATDDIARIVFTKSVALPQDTLPLPEARLSISRPEELVARLGSQTSYGQSDFAGVGWLGLGETPSEAFGPVAGSGIADGRFTTRVESSGELDYAAGFREFKEIEDGWRVGDDLAPENSPMSWLSGIFSRYYPEFAVSPLTCQIGESGIAVEWCEGSNVIMLDIDLLGHVGEYFSFGHDLREAHVFGLDLDEMDTWTWLAREVDGLAQVS